jgi:hypothetical protein
MSSTILCKLVRHNTSAADCHILATIWQIVRSVFQGVSHRPLTAVTLLRYQAIPCVIYVRQSDSGTGFPPNTSFSPYQYHSGIASQ